MKREEKNQQTKRRIMDAALAEFSTQGYAAGSTNTICAAQNISKGIIYHYFESKDGLFLACVDECFGRLTEYIRNNMPDWSDAESGLEDYFAVRAKFFYSNPVYQRIFSEAVLSPPAHLRGEIQKCGQCFDDLNIQILEHLLTFFSLRQGISKDEVIEIFRQFQDFISVHYQMSNTEDTTFDTHEEKCRKALNILLYGVILCLVGIVFLEPLMRAFEASDASLPQAKDYAFWMFIAALANLPAQSMNCAARAESSVKISSLATTVSQFVTFFILTWFYASGRSIIKIKAKAFKPSWKLIKTVAVIGIPTAVIQICLSVAASLTNIAAAGLPQSDEIIAAYGVVQRLILIGCYVVMGFMQGYQPVASFAFGAKNEERFHQSVRFALKGSLLLTVLVAAVYILLSKPLIMLFNQNPVIVNYGKWLLISQVALYPAFGLCYMMTITYQTIGSSRYGLFLSLIRQPIS